MTVKDITQLIQTAILEMYNQYIGTNLWIMTVFLVLVLIIYGIKYKGMGFLKEKGGQIAGLCIFVIYMCFVVEITLFSREPGSRIGTSMKFFGTYAPNACAVSFMIENILLFLPFGILVAGVFKTFRKWYVMFPAGFLASLIIEEIQLITGRGYFQVDDIWLNGLGAILGWGIYKIWERIWEKRSRWLAFIPSIIIMLLISGFSGDSGEESASLSLKVTESIVTCVEHTLPESMKKDWNHEQKVEDWHYFVRKAAHMTEYAVLTISLFLAFGWNGVEDRRRILYALVICFLYACLDETHQRMVPGRSGNFVDVLIDTSGGVFAMVVPFIKSRR